MRQRAVPGKLENRLTAQWMGLARAGIAFGAWFLVNPVVHMGPQLLSSSARATQDQRQLLRWWASLWKLISYRQWEGSWKVSWQFSQGEVFAHLSGHNLLSYPNKAVKCLPLKTSLPKELGKEWTFMHTHRDLSNKPVFRDNKTHKDLFNMFSFIVPSMQLCAAFQSP